LDEERPGVEQLFVVTDHPPALSTIPPEAMKRGYGCEIEELKPGEWRIHIFKGA
jgi:TusA-related sulfurtransferase